MAQPNASFRLSDEARELLGRIAVRLGLTRRGVLELAIREKAQRLDAQDKKSGAAA